MLVGLSPAQKPRSTSSSNEFLPKPQLPSLLSPQHVAVQLLSHCPHLWCRQVHAVVVAQEVVAHNAGGLGPPHNSRVLHHQLISFCLSSMLLYSCQVIAFTCGADRFMPSLLPRWL
jgi:hypothetical protein